jgi:tRNA uridine 5-carboxymethylaminomethyl modification enzyme
MQVTLNSYPNLSIKAGSVRDVTFFKNNHERNGELPLVSGVQLATGEVISCSQVVICTGTFLAGEIHIGMDTSYRYYMNLIITKRYPSIPGRTSR